jgi:natural product precursor
MKIKQLNLAVLSNNELRARQMGALKGGAGYGYGYGSGYSPEVEKIRGVCGVDLCNCGTISPARTGSESVIKEA